MVCVIATFRDVIVGVVDFVDNRAARHEEHALCHGVVEQMEECPAEDECAGVVITGIEEPQSCS